MLWARPAHLPRLGLPANNLALGGRHDLTLAIPRFSRILSETMSSTKKKNPASGSPKIDPDAMPHEPPTKKKLAKEPVGKSASRIHADHFASGRVCAALCQDRECVTLIENTGYCRLFYIKNWQQIQKKRGILKGGQLDKYIAEIANKYPDKYLEAIRADLGDIQSFRKVVTQLDLEVADIELPDEEEGVEDVVGSVKADVDIDTDDDA